MESIATIMEPFTQIINMEQTVRYSLVKPTNTSSPTRLKTSTAEQQRRPGITTITPLTPMQATSPKQYPDTEDIIATTKSDLYAEIISKSRRIELGFSLVSDGVYKRPTPAQFQMLANIFPDTYEVALLPPRLVFRVRKLPAGPWPFLVAGVAAHVTVDPQDDGYWKGTRGRGKAELGEVPVCKEHPYKHGHIFGVRDLLQDEYHVQLAEVHWGGTFWELGVVPGELPIIASTKESTIHHHWSKSEGFDIDNVPGWLYGCPVYYRSIRDYSTHHGFVLPHMTMQTSEPGNTGEKVRVSDMEADDTDYIKAGLPLRPGMMSSGSRDTNGEYSVGTSGVLLDEGGPSGNLSTRTENSRVFHQNPEGTRVGEIVDVQLTQLQPAIRFGNTPFGGGHDDEATKAHDFESLHVGDRLCINSPCTGFTDGIVDKVSVIEERCCQPYFGATLDVTLDKRSIGTAVFNSRTKELLGFLMSVQEDGRCLVLRWETLGSHNFDIKRDDHPGQ